MTYIIISGSTEFIFRIDTKRVSEKAQSSSKTGSNILDSNFGFANQKDHPPVDWTGDKSNMEPDLNGVPYCATCRHYHVQGCACPECGHIGRSNIFTKMRNKAAKRTGFSLWSCGNGRPDGCDMTDQSDQWAVLRELRGNLYRINGGTNIHEEFNTKEERDSRHMMWSIGDKPIVLARYQLLVSDTGDIACNLDRFAFIPGYLERDGIAGMCIQAWIGDAKQLALLLIQERQACLPSTHPQEENRRFLVHIPEMYTGVLGVLQQGGFVVTGAVRQGILQLQES